MKRFAVLAVSLVSMAAIVSCGGGGGDDAGSAAPPGPSAEGYYAGNLKVSASPAVAGDPALAGSSTAFQMLVLENGQFLTIYGTPNGNQLDVRGFAQGSGASNAGSFFATGVKNFASPRTAPPTDATASARYDAAAKSITGTIIDARTTTSFTSAAQPAPAFDFNSAATLATLTGVWNVQGAKVQGVEDDRYVLTVAADGSFSATPSVGSGCSFSGTFAPRASMNVFNVSVTNGPSPCTAPNVRSTGVAYVAPAGAQSQLTFATVSADRTSGAVISGVR